VDVKKTLLRVTFIHGVTLTFYSWVGIEDRKGKKLCSVCSPTQYSNGKTSRYTGQWYGKFEIIFLPLGMFFTNGEGNLAHKETLSTDFTPYIIPDPFEF